MDEADFQQIIFEIPTELELSEEEVATLIQKFRTWLIDTKPEGTALQTKVKQIQARVKSHGGKTPRKK